MGKKIMVVDGGARGHAVAEAYARDGYVDQVIVTPGNEGITGLDTTGKIEVVPRADLKDPQSFLNQAEVRRPDLIDVVQDDALAVGTVDVLQDAGFFTMGPTRNAARLEWDKQYAREVMERAGIAVPTWKALTSNEEALAYAAQRFGEVNLLFGKLNGLAGGKGVVAFPDYHTAHNTIAHLDISTENPYVIEDAIGGLAGMEELSVYVATDGEKFFLFPAAQDNKRQLPFDEGPNTGGMGAHVPASIYDRHDLEILNLIGDLLVQMREGEGTPYTGIMYLGLGVNNEDDQVYPVEINSRWGDPEVQAIAPGIKTPLYQIAEACSEGFGEIGLKRIIHDGKKRVCITGASRGYPGNYSAAKGKAVLGLEGVMNMPNVHAYSAGLGWNGEGFTAQGGRLFSVVGEGDTLREARGRALQAMGNIHVEGNVLQYRPDIAARDIAREYNV